MPGRPCSVKGQRNRWRVVAPVTSVCIRCGVIRVGWGRWPERKVARYHTHERWYLVDLPPCTGVWPEGWQPQYLELIGRSADA